MSDEQIPVHLPDVLSIDAFQVSAAKDNFGQVGLVFQGLIPATIPMAIRMDAQAIQRFREELLEAEKLLEGRQGTA